MSGSAQPVTILVAASDAAIRQQLQVSLARWGHEVIATANAADAQTLLQNEGVDVCILDWEMEGRNGLALCEWIRASDLRTDPEVVLLSSRREREDLQQAYSAGADHFLTKPFDTAELIPLLAGIAARVHDQRLAEAGLQHAADKIGPAGVHHRDLADLREKAFRRMG